MIVTTKYYPVSFYMKKKGKCPVCGKRVVRSKKFEHTINPWNKNSSGEIKTYAEVSKDVEKEANDWIPDFTHDKCK